MTIKLMGFINQPIPGGHDRVPHFIHWLIIFPIKSAFWILFIPHVQTHIQIHQSQLKPYVSWLNTHILALYRPQNYDSHLRFLPGCPFCPQPGTWLRLFESSSSLASSRRHFWCFWASGLWTVAPLASWQIVVKIERKIMEMTHRIEDLPIKPLSRSGISHSNIVLPWCSHEIPWCFC